MYAVIRTGGKQYRVTEGETFKVEKLEAEEGERIELNEVLLVASGDDFKVGAPILNDAKVTAEVISHGRSAKIKIIKFRRRKHHRKQMGHRQSFTELKITGIES